MKKSALIAESDGVIRVDKYLSTKHPEYSRAALAKLFTLDLVSLNGKPIQPGHKLRPGGELEYDLSPLKQKPEVIDLPVIYEDDDVVVINKPDGVISHARGRYWQEASVASFLRDKVVQEQKLHNKADVLFQDEPQNTSLTLKDAQESIRAGIVHRLDRATSGVMICAKNKRTHAFLQKQFADRTTKKSYIAVVAKAPKQEEAEIDAPIARNEKEPKKFCVHAHGKESQTLYKLVGSSTYGSVLLLRPKTGRTHQIRVHLDYIERTIVGDQMYGGAKNDRLLLHAYELEIKVAPGKTMVFTAPIPDEFKIEDDLQL